ncbi:acetylxylan esterase [Bacteroides sp. ET336]|uniref:acetylxylan esterase n=1 Tax=Bacteroides sp. ET336 TaxID=2972459 RepID=UPI0021ABADCE|nr:acetylxylan esterase [Bacteroides sp. ET336]MCR8893310.1 acetylxylan esterase [Bacteroides sp. ET336]MDN0057807.1 acetylxylan esterase [Bacteroides caecigallinarum]
MRNRILLTITVCIMTILSMAENYPYRSDLLWVTEPDHPDWIYRTGEKAKIKISLFKYGIPQDGITVNYETGSELMPSDKTGSITLKNGKAEINIGTLDKPGFRDCIFSVMINGKKYSHHVKVGFSPDKIKPYTEMPDGFMDFWKNNIKEASEFPLKYTKEKAEEYCTEKIDCYLIKLQLNNRGQAVYGYLFYPKNAKPESCPVVLSPPGAGIKTIKEPLRHKYYAEEGFIRLEFEIHGLNPTMSEEQFKEISNAFNGKENGYLTNGLDNKDNYYMKRVYLSCLRCIDLLTSLPEWDGKNVIVQGGSQGGALAMITAGLDKRVTACVVNHPALSDMAGYMAGRAGGYPHFFRTRGMDTKEKLETMSYYDVVNFARLIKADTFMTWGFNDNTCPPTTSYAVYNTLECNKEALITPINEHWTSEETERGHLEWIKKHLK